MILTDSQEEAQKDMNIRDEGQNILGQERRVKGKEGKAVAILRQEA